ncbi:MAG: hypothetical protein HY544_01080 [Candidatus Diapherotrites archaeon]|uniref:Uncharacterized protein n=1 Tax=Candidatus Iainarchaeum sp. TaxID=3101447 RepID=A0A8T3YJ58_9ARCH|nr:hypothetical protein [Candidatus Diapherotrites archaeon]
MADFLTLLSEASTTEEAAERIVFPSEFYATNVSIGDAEDPSLDNALVIRARFRTTRQSLSATLEELLAYEKSINRHEGGAKLTYGIYWTPKGLKRESDWQELLKRSIHNGITIAAQAIVPDPDKTRPETSRRQIIAASVSHKGITIGATRFYLPVAEQLWQYTGATRTAAAHFYEAKREYSRADKWIRGLPLWHFMELMHEIESYQGSLQVNTLLITPQRACLLLDEESSDLRRAAANPLLHSKIPSMAEYIVGQGPVDLLAGTTTQQYTDYLTSRGYKHPSGQDAAKELQLAQYAIQTIERNRPSAIKRLMDDYKITAEEPIISREATIDAGHAYGISETGRLWALELERRQRIHPPNYMGLHWQRPFDTDTILGIIAHRQYSILGQSQQKALKLLGVKIF